MKQGKIGRDRKKRRDSCQIGIKEKKGDYSKREISRMWIIKR